MSVITVWIYPNSFPGQKPILTYQTCCKFYEITSDQLFEENLEVKLNIDTALHYVEHYLNAGTQRNRADAFYVSFDTSTGAIVRL